MKIACNFIKKSIIYFWLIIIYSNVVTLQAQSRYLGDFHMGPLLFITNTITVDPGPNWLGYSLDKESAYTLSTSHGILWKGVFFTGLGAEFQQFQGKQGLSGFLSFATHPTNKKFSLTWRLKIGYSHLWNQYEGGTSSKYIAPGLGVVWNVSARIALELTTGFTWMQQSLLWPLEVGFRF